MSSVVIETDLGKLQGRELGISANSEMYRLPCLRWARFALLFLSRRSRGRGSVRQRSIDNPAATAFKAEEHRRRLHSTSKRRLSYTHGLSLGFREGEQSELCPVVVFFHGGAYQAHAGSLDWYDGSVLASRGGLVVVSANYRLGALGFLTKEGSGDGRQGLLDMIAALQWVANHIESFGGDPGRVTVMGQSAGGHAITCRHAGDARSARSLLPSDNPERRRRGSHLFRRTRLGRSS